MRFLLATRNPHKTREISEILQGFPAELVTLDGFPDVPEVVEDQPTIEGNARKKAQECAKASGLWCLADDTALEVDALGGAPGVLSARYAGPDCDYAANNAKLLDALEGRPPGNRKALFRAVMALAGPAGEIFIEEGRLAGEVALAPRGENGFGYDPVFYVPALGKTLAELSPRDKNAVSHRSQALRRIAPRIRKVLAALCALCLPLISAPQARAGRTEPGQETVWDQIMASQAFRELRIGQRYMDEQRYDLAAKEFQRAVAANPKDPMAHMMLGAAQYWNGEVDKSLESYRRSLELDPQNAQAYMLIGISLAWRGEAKASHEAFLKAAQLEPNRADIQMNLGSIEESLGMVPKALEHFRQAAVLQPSEPLYHFQLGMLYRKLGRDQDAAESFYKALKLFGSFEDALLELGALEERRGDRKAAIHSFKKAVNLKERDAVARFRLGRLYLLDGERKKARRILTEAFHLTPEEGGPGLRLSISYSGGKKSPAQAGKPGEKPAPPTPEASDPLDVFARNLERIPFEQSALMQVDVLFVPKPQLTKASPESPASLKKALERQIAEARQAPKAVRRDYQIRASKPPERERQIRQVLDDLRAVMREAPEGSDVRLGMNLNFTRLADLPAGRADSGEAKVSYQPRQVGNDMGLWVMGTGWMALVEEVLPEAAEAPVIPEESDWWVATGLGYATVGEAGKALSAFEKAVALDPKNETALLGRGVASVMTGNEAAATASYQEVLAINPKNRPAKEGLKWLLRPSTKGAQARQGESK